jgi:hypothetical protein
MMIMVGFEPTKYLHRILNAAPLTRLGYTTREKKVVTVGFEPTVVKICNKKLIWGGYVSVIHQ